MFLHRSEQIYATENKLTTHPNTRRKTTHLLVRVIQRGSDYSLRSKLPSSKGLSGDMSSSGRVAFRSPVATPCPVVILPWLGPRCEDANRLLGWKGSEGKTGLASAELARETLCDTGRTLRTVLERCRAPTPTSVDGRRQAVAGGIATPPGASSGPVAASINCIPGSTVTPRPLRVCCGGSW